MGAVVSELVVFNDDETAEKGQDTEPVDDGVDVGAFYFLPLRVGGLDDQDCLGVEEDGGQIQELGGRGRVSSLGTIGEVGNDTGWAEKRDKGARKTLAHTAAVSLKMSAWMWSRVD